MATAATATVHAKLDKSPSKAGMLVFGIILVGGIAYAAISLLSDISGVRTASGFAYFLLGIALLIALGFEFVNGFHDTANAVATVIYTHSLEPHIAVVWSGCWNFLGVLASTRRGGLRDHLAAAGGADPAGRQRRGIRDGLRAVGRGHHLEPRHLVFRTALLELAHPDRLDHRRGHRQPADVGARRHQRRGLGTGRQHRQVAADLAAGRLRLRGSAPPAVARS